MYSNKYEHIEDAAHSVHEKKMDASVEAEELSTLIGGASASYKMYFAIYSCMMAGQTYKRTANTNIIREFLIGIHTRYGKEKLQTALQATAGHIAYLEHTTKSTKQGLRNVVNEMVKEYAVQPPEYDFPRQQSISDDETERIWLFQANPKYVEAYQTLEDTIQTLGTLAWSFHTYAGEIRKGDRVYIWAAGKNAGVIAEGIFASAPVAAENAIGTVTIDKDRKPSPFSVQITISTNLLDRIVPRALLLADSRTNRMAVITYPSATSFRVTPEEDEVIQSVIHGSYHPEPVLEESAAAKRGVHRKYWMYTPGQQARLWQECLDHEIMALGWDGLGDLSQYAAQEDIAEALREAENDDRSYRNSSLATWQFVHEMQVGDIVYVKKGNDTIIGRGDVLSDYIYDATRAEYRNTRSVEWTPIDNYKLDDQYPGKQLPLKTLTDITTYTAVCKWLDALTANEVEEEDRAPQSQAPAYGQTEFLSKVFLTKEEHDTLLQLLRRKKNIILQGAPGVGKTFAAKRLAYTLMGIADDARIASIQFHQSYSYEDFIMGYRPQKEGFSLEWGVFYTFCKMAEQDSENPYCFIIDEINRGNLSKIFGELMMLLEADKRGQSLRLLYQDEQFSIPRNVYIIGMMNTADRGLAMLDYALRRRFCFFTMTPRFDHPGFEASLTEEGAPDWLIHKIIGKMNSLNQIIAEDKNLGPDFCIGHSYFCDYTPTDHWYEDIIHYEIKPLLEEYFMDEDRDKLSEMIDELLR